MDRNLIHIFKCAGVLLLSLLMCMPGLLTAPGDTDGDALPSTSASAAAQTRAYKTPTGVHYAIITPDNFYNALVPLAEWKTQKGVPTRIYTLENISALYSGPDLQYKIHKHLEGLEAADPSLTWVLLVGDSQHIPVRYLRANAEPYGFNKDYAGDYYYTGLDSDWDTNGNGIYGEYKSSSGYEADLYTDAYVGRWPIDNRTQAEWLVDKVLTYEKTPPTGSWVREFEMWGTLMDAPNDPTKYDSYEDNAYKVCQKIFDDVLTRNFSNLTNTNFNVTRRYDYARLDGGYYTLGNDQLKNSAVIDNINHLGPLDRGVSIVNFAGQAYYDGTRLAHYSSTTGMDDTNYGPAWPGLLSYADDAALTNGYKLPFILAATCDAANFTKTNDQGHEQLFMNPGGGAIGFLSNTGTSYRGENGDGTSYGNWWLNYEFWYSFKFDLNTRPAQCWFDTIEHYRNDVLMHQPVKEPILSNIYGYVYMGDPEVDIWTDTPYQISLQGDQLYTGTRNYTFSVTANGKPVPYARICLRGPDTYETFTANITGVAVRELTFTATGFVDATVTGHNGLYQAKTLGILTAPPDLYIDPASVHLSNTTALKAGDVVNISVTVKNLGDLPAIGAYVGFYDGQPGVDPNYTKIGTSFPLGDLAPGASRQAWAHWTALGGDHTIFISAVSTSNDLDPQNNNATFQLSALYPDLEISDTDLQFTPGGTAVVGSMINISVKVRNNGSCDANGVGVRLFDGNRTAGVLIGEISLALVPKGGYASGHVNWTVTSSDHPIHAYVNPDLDIFELDLSDNVAYGLVQVDEPPVFYNLTNLTLSEDENPAKTQRLLDLGGHASDADNPFADLSFSVSATGPNTIAITGGYVNLTLKKDWYGEFWVNLSMDDTLAVATGSFKVTVLEVNDQPVLDLSKKEFNVYEHTDFTLKVSAYDVENETLAFADDTDLFDIDPATGIINYTPRAQDLDKVFYVNITVADAGGAKNTAQLKLNVIGVNDKPHLDPIANQTIWVGSEMDLTVTANDPDGDHLTFSDDTPMFDINATTGRVRFTPVKEHAGVRNVTITVSDGELSDHYTFMTTIKINGTGQEDDDIADDDTEPFVGSALFYGLIIGLVLLTIAIVVIIVLLSRKRKDGTGAARQPQVEEGHPPEDLDEPPARPAPASSNVRKGSPGKRSTKRGSAPIEGPEAAPGPAGPVLDDFMAEPQLPDGQEGAALEHATPQGPEGYAQKGEIGFDEGSFDEAFGDELDEEGPYPDMKDDEDGPQDMLEQEPAQEKRPPKRSNRK